MSKFSFVTWSGMQKSSIQLFQETMKAAQKHNAPHISVYWLLSNHVSFFCRDLLFPFYFLYKIIIIIQGEKTKISNELSHIVPVASLVQIHTLLKATHCYSEHTAFHSKVDATSLVRHYNISVLSLVYFVL